MSNYTTINKSTDYFNTNLYTGNDADNRGITGIGFQPDWVWIKKRSNAAGGAIFDAVRGAGKVIYPSETNAEGTETASFVSFDSDGYTISQDSGVGLNVNSHTYVGWNWKANGQGSSNTAGSINTTYTSVNTTAGFSISSFTGTGANATVGHGLGAVPKMIIVKNRSDSDNWVVYHQSLGNTDGLYLNTTDSTVGTNTFWNNTTPTTTVFSVGTHNRVNGSGDNMIAYCFAEKTGYSKFGSYTGNGNADGTFVYTGFKPAWIMYKNTSGTSDWYIQDIKRRTFNVNNVRLEANNSDAEVTGASDSIDILSNGFKLRHSSGSFNISGNNYIYMAFGQSLVGSNNVPCTAR